MLAKVYSAAVYGVDAYEVEIEVNASTGAPVTVVVGLPDATVKESRDSVVTAVANSGYGMPKGRTTINLAPADVKKGGPSFDLPIALRMIAQPSKSGSRSFATFASSGSLRSTALSVPSTASSRSPSKPAGAGSPDLLDTVPLGVGLHILIRVKPEGRDLWNLTHAL